MARRSYISFRNILRLRDPPRVEPVEPKRSKTLWRIPAEIVEMIFQLLSDLDRACFALCCKRPHVCYVSHNKQYRISVLSKLPRTLLLRRLQNERWVYCHRCQNLHQNPRWRFLSWKCDPQPAISECNAWCDVQHDDSVDICPCSTRLNKSTKTFQVGNQLVFQTSKETASSELFQKIGSRPSRYETGLWLKDFFHDQSNFFIGDESSNWYQCHGWSIAKGKPYNFKITLHRDLRGDRRPSKGWEDNCHN
ncbi:unnamed protein product [Penicillium roqueforti FM164]|uniref:F-box domain-containing protein n=1 Tax=Penicillium roqueforti (strain FM164) TaxID=1365484 RepID=W6QRR9_PENRF|nr:unnamed protein product [Penicillium roqueforti FM164]